MRRDAGNPLRGVAAKALQHYAIAVQKMRFYAEEDNFLFLVYTSSQKYILKLCRPGERSLQNQQEIYTYVATLTDTASLHYLKPVANSVGQEMTQITVHDQQWQCALFPWVTGKSLHQCLSLPQIRQWGSLMGHFHAQSLQWPAYGQSTALRRWDQVFYWQPSRLHLHPLLQYTPANTLDCAGIYHQMLRHVADTLHKIWQGGTAPIRIHGDLHFYNVLSDKGRLTALDFDDMAWGYPIQDVAVALLNLRDDPAFEKKFAAFKAGYQEMGHWPQHHEVYLTDLMMGRLLWIANASLFLTEEEGSEEDNAERLLRFAQEFATVLPLRYKNLEES